MASTPAPPQALLSVCFNQNFECVACGAEGGFRVYNVAPFGQTLRRDFPEGGVRAVEMLFRSNILALVGGGRSAAYPPNKVMIWDDHQARCIGELSFRKEVRAVRLRRDRVVVALEHKVYVYNFSDLKLLHQIETASNAAGLVALSPGSASTVLACPGIHSGQVRVELYDLRRTKFINAHDGALACLALSLDGALLATASEKGTLVRVWSAAEGTMLHEFRRGADRATIYSIAFAPEAPLLAVASERGTVHVFSMNKDGGGGGAAGGADQGQQGGSPGAAAGSPARANKQSAIAWMGGLLPKYFKSEWSFMQFKLPEGVPSQVAFSSPTELVAACVDGSFHRFTFDATTGQGQATGMERLLSGDEDQAAAAADGGVAADGMR